MKKIITVLTLVLGLGFTVNAQMKQVSCIPKFLSRGDCGPGGGMCLSPTFPSPSTPVLLYSSGKLTIIIGENFEGVEQLNRSLNFTEDQPLDSKIAKELGLTNLTILKQNMNGQAKQDEKGSWSVVLKCAAE